MMQFHVLFLDKCDGVGFGCKGTAKGNNGVAFSGFKELVHIACNGMDLDMFGRPKALKYFEERVFEPKHINAVGLALDFESGEESARVLFVEFGAEIFLPRGRVGDQTAQSPRWGEAKGRTVMGRANIYHMRNIGIGFKKKSLPCKFEYGGFALQLIKGHLA